MESPDDHRTRTGSGRGRSPIRDVRQCWLGHDRVVQFRQWGTEIVYPLPGPDARELVLGDSPDVALRVVDPQGLISRRHAQLLQDDAGWHIGDLGSKNGTFIDDYGIDVPWAVPPGAELRLGSLTLVAENQTLIDLRGYLARILGWNAEVRCPIDRAIRAIRAVARRSSHLVITGPDDLVAVARQIHLRTTSPDTPFVVYGRRMYGSDGSIRVTATVQEGAVARELAANGTICVRTEDEPTDHPRFLVTMSAPRPRAQLFLCARKTQRRSDAPAPPILVPELSHRSPEDLHRIVSEYAVDALRELEARPTSFTEHDRIWVARHAATSFAHIEVATRRLVALRDSGNVQQAAARLGLSHVALGKWLKRRKLASSRRHALIDP